MKPHFKHQTESIKKFSTVEKGLDFSDPGTGKTRVQIDLFDQRRNAGGGCALVIGPRTLLEAAWVEDFRKFAPARRCSVAYASNRVRAFKSDADVYITNTDGTRFLAKQKPDFFAKFDTLIIDELSTFKHRTSLRSRCLRKILKHFRYIYGLTGTPSTNSISDVWHQAFIVDEGVRLGTNFFKFRFTVAKPIQTGRQANMVKWVDKPGAGQAVADLLSDITVRYTLEECHSLPENRVYHVPYILPPDQMKAYKDMENHAIHVTQSGEVVNAVNAAVLGTKLLQIASGAVYDESSTTVHLEDGRYKLISDLVAARAHSLVFFSWKHQKEALEKAFRAAKPPIPYCVFDGDTSDKDRIRYVKEFQAGLYQAAIAHPKTAAHGLTLTKGVASIWSGPVHDLEWFIQANHRIFRAGQTHKTETILVTAKGTVEQQVYNNLQGKNARQVDFLRIIRNLA
jgi:SNF2 family DNA or RNA helicase